MSMEEEQKQTLIRQHASYLLWFSRSPRGARLGRARTSTRLVCSAPCLHALNLFLQLSASIEHHSFATLVTYKGESYTVGSAAVSSSP